MRQKEGGLALSLKFSVHGPKVQFNLDKITRAFATQFVQDVAAPQMETQLVLMTERAQSNKRADGGVIKDSYSEGYLAAIIAGNVRGANGVRKRSETPNLTITGEFLQSMKVGKLPNGAKAYFAANHATTGNHTLRNAELAGYLFNLGFDGWFDFSKEDKMRFNKAFDSFLDRHSKDIVTTT